MANLMDNTPYNQGVSLQQAYQNAMRDPKAFIEQIKRSNPQAYQRAMQLANSSNPQTIVMQILQSRGLNPGMFNLPGF